MKQSRRMMLRMLLLSPLTALGLKTVASAEEDSSDSVCVRPHCGICGHYVPSRRFGLTIDGPPSSYCRHPASLRGYYETEELIFQFKLYRDPGDSCELFALRDVFRPVCTSLYCSKAWRDETDTHSYEGK